MPLPLPIGGRPNFGTSPTPTITPTSGYTALPGGVPNSGSPVGNSSKVPWWLSGGAALLGGILGVIGKNKHGAQDQAAYQQAKADAAAKAKGKAALMKGILQANGYGNLMTDDQILEYVTTHVDQPNTAGNTIQDIGGMLMQAGLGSTFLGGNAPATKLGAPTTSGLNGAPVVNSTSVPAGSVTGDPATSDPAAQDFWNWWTKTHDSGGGNA